MVRNSNWIIILPLLGSLAINLLFFLRSIPVQNGIGTYKRSPDGAFVASADNYSNLNPLAADYKTITGNLKIDATSGSSASDYSVTLKVIPPGVKNEAGYYLNLEKPITWSTDSTTVTFNLPHMVVAVTPKTDHEIFSAAGESQSSSK